MLFDMQISSQSRIEENRKECKQDAKHDGVIFESLPYLLCRQFSASEKFECEMNGFCWTGRRIQFVLKLWELYQLTGLFGSLRRIWIGQNIKYAMNLSRENRDIQHRNPQEYPKNLNVYITHQSPNGRTQNFGCVGLTAGVSWSDQLRVLEAWFETNIAIHLYLKVEMKLISRRFTHSIRIDCILICRPFWCVPLPVVQNSLNSLAAVTEVGKHWIIIC